MPSLVQPGTAIFEAEAEAEAYVRMSAWVVQDNVFLAVTPHQILFFLLLPRLSMKFPYKFSLRGAMVCNVWPTIIGVVSGALVVCLIISAGILVCVRRHSFGAPSVRALLSMELCKDSATDRRSGGETSKSGSQPHSQDLRTTSSWRSGVNSISESSEAAMEPEEGCRPMSRRSPIAVMDRLSARPVMTR